MAINFLTNPKTKSGKFFKIQRDDLLILFCAFLVFIVGFLFPIDSVYESVFASLILLLVFPSLIIKFVLRMPFGNFGLQMGDKNRGLIYAIGTVLAFAFINYFLIFKFGLAKQFSTSPGVSPNFWLFLGYELFGATLSVFFLDFFFRGFIQLGLEKNFGTYALFFQAVVNAAIFYKSSWLVIFSNLILFLIAGVIVKRSRSVAYSTLAIWLISLLTDIMLIKAFSP